MEEDIISKIDQALDKIQKEQSSFLLKENVLKVFDYLIEDVPDDKILLETQKYFFSKNWNSYNEDIREQFDRILSYYGIKENRSIDRKMIVQKQGNTFVKRVVRLSNYNNIKELLN